MDFYIMFITREEFKRCSGSEIVLKISAFSERLYHNLIVETNKLKKQANKEIDIRSNENIIKIIATFRSSSVKTTWTENYYLLESHEDLDFQKIERSFSISMLRKIKNLVDAYNHLTTPKEVEKINKKNTVLKAKIEVMTNTKAFKLLTVIYKEVQLYIQEKYPDIIIRDKEEKTSNLYIAIYPNKNIIKIGRSNNLQKKLDYYAHFWGTPDYCESYYINTYESEVLKLDKALNTFLSHYKIDCMIEDGSVEVFKREALDLAIKHIEMYLQSHPENQVVLKKGIEVKNVFCHFDKNHLTESKQVKTLLNNIKSNSNKIEQLNNLVFIFMKRSKTFIYQYDLERDEFVIRFQSKDEIEKEKLLSICYKLEESLEFNVFKEHKKLPIKMIQSIKTCNDIVQIKFKIKGYNDPILDYTLPKILASISKIPKRSRLLKDDLRFLV